MAAEYPGGGVGVETDPIAEADLAAHVAAADPHTQYQKESEKGAANGYASLDGSGLVPTGQLPITAPADASTTVKGISKLSVAPASPSSPIAVGDNDPRNSDQRTPTDGSVTAAKVNTALKPSGSAATTDESLRRLGTASSHAAAGDDSRFPSAGQKNALAGTSGTPGTGNEYVTTQDARLSDARTPADGTVTDAKIATTLSPSKITGTAVVTADSRLSDARTPTAHAASHAAAGSDPLTLSESQVTGLTTDLAAKAAGLAPTAVKTANYSASASEFVPVDASSGSVTVTLPTAPADKTRIAVKMIAVASTNTVTIARGGTDVFNKAGGSTSLTLSLLNQGAILQYASATGIWYVQSTDVPLSGLDARFAALASPAFTGTPTAPDQTTGDNSGAIANTKFVQTASGLLVPKSLVTTKGDLIVGTGASTVVRKAVGADGTFLAADSAQTDGLRWRAVPGDLMANARRLGYVAMSMHSRFVQNNNAAQTNGRLYATWIPMPEGGTIAALTFYLGQSAIGTTGAEIGVASITGTLLGRATAVTALTGATGKKTISLAAEAGQSLTVAAAETAGVWAVMNSIGSTTGPKLAGRQPTIGAIQSVVENNQQACIISTFNPGTGQVGTFSTASLVTANDADIWWAIT